MPRSESSEVETGEREVQGQFELSNLSMASCIRCRHELPILQPARESILYKQSNELSECPRFTQEWDHPHSPERK